MIRKLEDIKINRPRKIIRTSYIEENPRKVLPIKNKTEKNSNNGKFIFYLLLIILVLFGFYSFLNIFYKANISIEAKHELFTLKDKVFTTSKDENNLIPFEITIITEEDEETATLTDSENVSLKAKGEITLYNEYSTTPQSISSGTYISDDKGKTYMINTSVKIPGYKIEESKVVPGQIDAKITAFLTGDSYNGNPNSFNIISFKNTPKYNKIYAKTKIPLTGGAQGLVYKLNSTKIDDLNKIANSSFKDYIMNKLEIPDGYILYKDATTFSYQIDEGILSPTPKTKVKMTGKLSAIIFKEKDLSKYLLRVLLPKISKEEFSKLNPPEISKLKFNFTDVNQEITKDLKSLSFMLNGDIDVIWNPDVLSLSNSLRGVSKNKISDIFKQDVGIASVSVKIFPPWKNNLPKSSSRINITVK